MTRRIVVTCGRCQLAVDGFLDNRGQAKNPHDWRYVGRDTDLCPDCCVAFEAWRTAPLISELPAGASPVTAGGSDPASP